MKIALFSDIHGKLLLPFKLVDLYQKATDQKIDLILQCGDVGIYPHLNRLDKATKRHAENDPDELGFYNDFTSTDPKIKNFLDQLNIEMFCVRGNHEDHEFLDELENRFPNVSRFPIDCYQKIWVCKSGWEQEFKVSDQRLTFVGIGRIGGKEGKASPPFIQEYERKKIKQLFKNKSRPDLLITHDQAFSKLTRYGMKEIRMLLDNVHFSYHFYGHTGQPFESKKDINGKTVSCKIAELEFDQSGILPHGCMLVLHLSQNKSFELEIVDQTLTNQLTKFNWKYDY